MSTRHRWALSLLLSASACRSPDQAPHPVVPDPIAVEDGCGSGPACEDPLTCVEYFPIVDHPGAPKHECLLPCDFAGNGCPEGLWCAMESAGPGLVCRAEEPSNPTPEIANLVALAKVWSFVRFTHPWLGDDAVDWNEALVAAIPAARAATTTEELRAAIGGLLASIGDPATALAEPRKAAPPSVAEPVVEANGTLVISVAAIDPYDVGFTRALGRRLRTADRVVFDLRGVSDVEAMRAAFHWWNPGLVDRPVVLTTTRTRVFHGFPSEMQTSGGYREAYETRAAITVAPKTEGKPPRVAFITDEAQLLPEIAVPLVERGSAVLVGTVPLDARVLTPTVSREVAGVEFTVRSADPVHADGRPQPEADLVDAEDPVGRAMALLARPHRARSVRTVPLNLATRASVRPRSAESPPDAAHRMLGAIDLWSTLDVFHAYPALRPRWDQALPIALAQLDDASTWEAYARVLLRLTASVDDGHAALWGEPVNAVLGAGFPPFRADFVNGALVVMELFDEEAAGDVRVGDVIASVDGVPVSERFAALAPLVAASTVGWHRSWLAFWVSSGAVAGPAHVWVIRDGERMEANFQRGAQPHDASEDGGSAWSRLRDGRVGLVDLSRLEVSEVEAMFEALRETEGIIFDMRGYPRGTLWKITPYLADGSGPTSAAEFLRPLVSDGMLGLSGFDQRTRFIIDAPMDDVDPYTGRVVMLIDGRTMSQAEHTGLMFDAVTDVTFVGMPTAGANGDITEHFLPDGLLVRFTGQAVASVEGPPLQRVGLLPDVRVAPTLAGVQAGRDEILDAALALF